MSGVFKERGVAPPVRVVGSIDYRRGGTYVSCRLSDDIGDRQCAEGRIGTDGRAFIVRCLYPVVIGSAGSKAGDVCILVAAGVDRHSRRDRDLRAIGGIGTVFEDHGGGGTAGVHDGVERGTSRSDCVRAQKWVITYLAHLRA